MGNIGKTMKKQVKQERKTTAQALSSGTSQRVRRTLYVDREPFEELQRKLVGTGVSMSQQVNELIQAHLDTLD